MVGDRIRELRQDLRVTQEKLAEVLGKCSDTIAAYEENSLKPDIETLKELADFFEVSMDYLAGRSKLKKQFEDNFDIDFCKDEAGILAGQALDNAYTALKRAVSQKNKELLKLLIVVYGSVRGVMLYEKPEGRIIINDEKNGVLVVIDNTFRSN